MDHLIKALLAGFTALASVVQADAPPPAHASGRLPAFFDAAISPDGKHLALVRNDDTGEQFLQIGQIQS